MILLFKSKKPTFVFLNKSQKRKGSIPNYRSFSIPTLRYLLCCCSAKSSSMVTRLRIEPGICIPCGRHAIANNLAKPCFVQNSCTGLISYGDVARSCFFLCSKSVGTSYQFNCFSVLRIPIPDPVSDFFPSRIPNPGMTQDLGSRIRIRVKEFKHFNLKN